MASTPYYAFGKALAVARLAAKIESQKDLAMRLGVTQQSVSRWEAGTHRPRPAQLPAIAAALNLNAGELRILIGDEGVPATPVVMPFPVDKLDADTFEAFVADFVALLYPGAQTRRRGASGHQQDGLDIDAVLADRRQIGIQCKRREQFGPAEFRSTAAKVESAELDMKILVLSRPASPQLARVVQNTPKWTLWDKDDISRRIRRELSIEDQMRLVDIYFPGQRSALLNRDEPGPWRTIEEFFLPFNLRESPLSHAWSLTGRRDEIDAVVLGLNQAVAPVVFLSGPGGFGKSRMLKEVVPRFAAENPAVKVRFLGSADAASLRSLEDLGAGAKLLVIDDAHDRDGLRVLFDFAANPVHKTRLLIATRPYAHDRIRREAAAAGVVDAPEIKIKSLSSDDLHKLAVEILTSFRAPEQWANHIVEASHGSPMVVALGARIVAKEGIPLELAKQTVSIRDLILGKFAGVIASDIGGRGEERLYRRALELLALVQPFNPGDDQLLELFTRVLDVGSDDASRGLKKLAESGIIFGRGAEWRLTPDILADFLIEESCLDLHGRLSPFAETALTVVPTGLFGNVLTNIARMDWRMQNGETAESPLLANVWRRLEAINDEYDPRLSAVKSAALFQPKQALAFIARQIGLGRKYHSFPEILRNVAYNSDYLEEVFEILWNLGQADDRETARNPGHPVRVLIEIGEYRDRRPVDVSSVLLKFGLKIAEIDASWNGPHTPAEILGALLATEGITTSSEARAISMTPFYVNYGVVEPIRKTVIEKTLALLFHPNLKISRVAADLVGKALQAPIGAFGTDALPELLALYEAEFMTTLSRLQEVMAQGVAATTAIAIARAVKWHAQHGSPPILKAARTVLTSLPSDLDFQLRRGLADSFGDTFLETDDIAVAQNRRDAWLDDVAEAILRANPNAERRRAYVEAALGDIVAAEIDLTETYALLNRLVQQGPFARAVINDALKRKHSLTRPYTGMALGFMLRRDGQAATHLAARLFESRESALMAAVADGYAGLGTTLGAKDFEIIGQILSSDNPPVVRSGIRTVSLWRDVPEQKVLDLLLNSKLHGNSQLAHDLCLAIAGTDRRRLEAMSRESVIRLLDQLLPIQKLNGHWESEVLAELSVRHPIETADFLIRRAELAAEQKSYEYRLPGKIGPGQRSLKFFETAAGQAALNRVWAWLISNQQRDHYFQNASQGIFKTAFVASPEHLVHFLEPRLPAASGLELRLISRLLRSANHNFVFEKHEFIMIFLARCQAVDPSMVDDAVRDLFASAISGVRSGIYGEPAPRDVADRQRSEKLLGGLSRVSPSYQLYDLIRRHACEDIARSRIEGDT